MITTKEVSKFAATHTHTPKLFHSLTTQFSENLIEYNIIIMLIMSYRMLVQTGQVLALNLNNKFKMFYSLTDFVMKYSFSG